MKVNLVNPGGGYSLLVNSFIAEISKNLDWWCGSTCSHRTLEDYFNIVFFRERNDVNGKIKEFKDLYISHGWFQKIYKRVPSELENIQYVGVPGPMVGDFLVGHMGVPREKIVEVGVPAFDKHWTMAKSIAGSEMEEYALDMYALHVMQVDGLVDDRQMVLWSPSHSAFLGPGVTVPLEFSKDIRHDFNVVQTAHPAMRPSWNTSKDYAMFADVCVSDLSGAFLEAWALGVPVVFPDWIIGGFIPASLGESPLGLIYDQQIGYHAHSPEDFEPMVRLAIENGITAEEIAFIDQFYPKRLRGKGGLAVARFLISISGEWER